MIPILRPPIRYLLQIWGDIGSKAGWRYRLIDRLGPALADENLVAYLPNGLSVPCDLRDEVQRNIYFWGCYEPMESMLFTRLIRPGMTVIDAGANVGNYTLLASSAVGPKGHVHAFEPVPATYARLTSSVALNNLENVTVNQAALWDSVTTLTLGVPKGNGRNDGAYTVGAAAAAVSADALPFDAYVEKHAITRVDIVKMDIEGSELHALNGMPKTLLRDHPLILMEVNRQVANAAGSSPAKLGQLLLNELGYRAWNVASYGAGPLESFDDVTSANVLLYTGDVPEAVRDMRSGRIACRWARSRMHCF